MATYGQTLNLAMSHCGVSYIDVDDESFNQFRAWIDSRLNDFWQRQPFSFNTEEGEFSVQSGRVVNPQGSPPIQKVLSIRTKSPDNGGYSSTVKYRIRSETRRQESSGETHISNQRYIEVLGIGDGEIIWLKYMRSAPSFNPNPVIIENITRIRDITGVTYSPVEGEIGTGVTYYPVYARGTGVWYNLYIQNQDDDYTTVEIDIPDELFHAIAYAVAADYQLHNDNLNANRTFLALAEEVFNSRSIEYEEMNVGQGSRMTAAW